LLTPAASKKLKWSTDIFPKRCLGDFFTVKINASHHAGCLACQLAGHLACNLSGMQASMKTFSQACHQS
jgi:hypothetical protein